MHLAQPWVSWAALPAGDPGTGRTLAEMEAAVRAAIRDPLVVQTARKIVARVPERDSRAEAEALLRWLQAHLRYTRDPTDYELLVPPSRLLREIQAAGVATEDCDSASMALAALLQAVGIRTRFRVLGAQPPRGADSRFSHVYVEALVEGGWLALDPTVRGRPLGYRPRG
ncbi:MAG: transglutaminase-like domain-containing protein, partial [Candidatus Methylomirabilales bacterium]